MNNDILQCIDITITDELLKNSKIASYFGNQTFELDNGKKKPYQPKTFPNKAIIIQFLYNKKPIEIYLDTKQNAWNSRLISNGSIGKLSPEQLDEFFSTKFYANLINSIAKKWPTSDPNYAKLYQAMMDCKSTTYISDDELNIIDNQNEIDEDDKINQPFKNKSLANKDVNGDHKRDYTGSGRKIVHFSDMGATSKGAEYYCWPRPGKEFKWNTWKEWKKLKPFAKMYFKHNGRKYMISLSLFDENFDHRGFRGADVEWKPPFAWVTPTEANQIMKLSIVRKFLKQCIKRIHQYIDMSPEEIYNKIDKKDRIDIKEIEKTIRVIKHVLKIAFKEQQADDYKYDR